MIVVENWRAMSTAAVADAMAAETVAAQRHGDGADASEHAPVNSSGYADLDQSHAATALDELRLVTAAHGAGQLEMARRTEEAMDPSLPCSETRAGVSDALLQPIDGLEAVDAPEAKAGTSSPLQDMQGQATELDQRRNSDEVENGLVALADTTALTAEDEGIGSIKPQEEPVAAVKFHKESLHKESLEKTEPKQSPESIAAPTNATDQGDCLQAKSEFASPAPLACLGHSVDGALTRFSKHHRLEVKLRLKIGAGGDRFTYESMFFKIHSAFSACLRRSKLGSFTFTCNMPKLNEDVSHEGKLDTDVFSDATLAWLKRNVSREL
eukprot:6173648-Pleurochrysis_carterae.AAC.1